MSSLIGLTGSIGMGKSTTAKMFADQGIPIWDADRAVHTLYAKGGSAVAPVSELVPDAHNKDAIDRDLLKQALAKDPDLFQKLEAIVHPLVAPNRAEFITAHADAPILLFDIPLLFETGAEKWLDAVVVVSAPPEIQRSRVLAREGMTEDRFQMILSRQIPDAEKRSRADFVVPTTDLDTARQSVTQILDQLRKDTPDA